MTLVASTKPQKGSTPIRKRTNSACSNKSMDSTKSTKLTTSKIQQQAQANNKNIVKKTIAKVTAAFKTTKLGTGEKNQIKLKTKSSASSQNKTRPELGPLKVEYKSNEQQQAIELEITEEHETTSSSNNRRCSSVPRTLKEKQALNKQITLGEKIQNFFSRDAHKSSKSRSSCISRILLIN